MTSGTARLETLKPELLREMLMQAGDVLDAGVLHVDTELVVRGWNRWLEGASGVSASEAVGRPLVELFPEMEERGALDVLRRVLAGETIVMAQRFHGYLLPLPRSGAGSVQYMQQSVRIVPHTLRDRVVGAIAFIQDVTDRVRREEELRGAIARAEAANIAKSEFLAAMSHELRTPLNVIVGYADLLEGEVGGSLSPRQREQVGRIKMSSWHLIGIIEEILTFARVEAGKVELTLEPVDLHAVVHDTVDLLSPQAVKKDLALRACTPKGSVVITTDALKLRQILLNLVGNALKFTESGEIRVELALEQNSALLKVWDTGAGIPEGAQERIFEPFTQLDQSIARARSGTGLGLPISRKLARLLGGDLTVTSAPGSGSVFKLALPVDGPAPGEPRSGASAQPEGGS